MKGANGMQPMHAEVEPVKAYAVEVSTLKGEPQCVVTIPEGSAAHQMGYRFVSIPETELAFYLASGAALA